MNLTSSKLIKASSSKTVLSAFSQIADLLVAEGSIKNKKKLIDGFKAREAESSTALAEGFAIPHTINDEISSPKVVILKKADISNWKTIDGSKVDTIIAIIVPKDGRGQHLTILSKLSAKLANAEFSSKIKNSSIANTAKEINSISNEDNKKQSKTNDKIINYDVVGVTSCPTGIAHTYMAAEYLENTAKEMNLSIKVETQGQTVQNILTQSEIDNAKGIIIAVDREIDMSRFAGKKIIQTGTKKVIANAKENIENALKDEGTISVPSSVRSTGNGQEVASDGQMSIENFGPRMFKSVMNGVSYMLPFVIFGGIFIALAFLIDTFSGNANAGSNFGHVSPVAGFLKDIGGVSMGLMVPILAAYIMFGLIGRPGLLPGFIIGLVAAGNGPIFTDVFGVASPSWLPVDFAGQTPASGFIGGILGAFYATIVVIYISKALDILPDSLRGIKQILLLPLLGTGAAVITFWFINIPLVYLMWGLLTGLSKMNEAGLTPLLTLLLAGMMAVDMGGPINKTSYVFGTVMLGTPGSDGVGYVLMAAVMAGGMVPPLAIAIATLFKRKTLWDQSDKEGGITNWVMGFSFVTEGAIPFASKYPKSVIPANIIGSAFVGLIVGLFGIGLQAPHGGIFVMALVNGYHSILGFTLPIYGAIPIYLISIIGAAALSASLIILMRSRELSKKEKSINNN